MFSITRISHGSNQAIAMLVAVALVAWGVGIHHFTKEAKAANVTSFSDLLSDSNPGSVSDHTLTFTIPNGMLQGETFVLTWPAGFDLTGIVEDDIDLTDDAAEQSTAGSAAAGVWGVSINNGAREITFTTPTDAGVGSSSVMVVEVGAHADASGTGANQITNPGSEASFEIELTGTMQDSGNTRVAIVNNVLVTAIVDTVFDFTVSGFNAAGTAVNGTTTNGTTTATLIDFGTLQANSIETRSQLLNVTTNAINGFSVTIEQDGELDSSTGAIIDGFIDGVTSSTSAAWQAPTANINDNTTWGHWGITSSDSTLTGGDIFANDQWLAASTTPDEIFAHTGPADGISTDIGSTTVGFQVQISPFQEAGDDYQTTLTYIATPTF